MRHINIAFTGHRPNKLPGGYDINSKENIELVKRITFLIRDIMIITGANSVNFITGGALGVDQFACDVGMFFKSKLKNIKVSISIAVPFQNQYIKWNQDDINRYFYQLQNADRVAYVDTIFKYMDKNDTPKGVYSPQKMQLRNKFMIDNCDYLVAVYDGKSKGGTKNAIDYAQSIDKVIYMVNPTGDWSEIADGAKIRLDRKV